MTTSNAGQNRPACTRISDLAAVDIHKDAIGETAPRGERLSGCLVRCATYSAGGQAATTPEVTDGYLLKCRRAASRSELRATASSVLWLSWSGRLIEVHEQIAHFRLLLRLAD
ncbi:MAG: hypothetical protein H6872_02525 [Methylobacteriaceae bacterium]|nr:hypothetical protein [Methylobacteriaceae bacterium]